MKKETRRKWYEKSFVFEDMKRKEKIEKYVILFKKMNSKSVEKNKEKE